jgi:hypothetical protein
LIRATDSIWNPAQKLRLSHTAMLVGLAIPAFLSHPALGSPDTAGCNVRVDDSSNHGRLLKYT